MMFRSAASLLLLASPLGVAADKGMAAKTVLLRGKAMLDQQNPIPPTVLECLMNPDETSCNSATDEDGKPCDWCNTLVGIGACMSEEAAELAKEFQPLFMCDGDANEIMSGVEPDVQECLENTDSDSCDQDSACDWCTTPFNADLGACLTNDLADKAKQFQPLVTCDGSSNMNSATTTVRDDPDDLLDCIQQADEDSCNGTVDEDGNNCSWCSTAIGGIGACLSSTYADMAKQFQPLVTCDGETVEDVKDDPDDLLDCIQQADEDSCNGTVDEDGNNCSWCSTAIGGFGACLSSTYADMTKQFQPLITCDGETMMDADMPAVEGPYDPMCTVAGLTSGGKSGCVSAVDMDEAACVWCTVPYEADKGLCLNQDQANYAQMWMDCTDPAVVEIEEVETEVSMYQLMEDEKEEEKEESNHVEDAKFASW